MVFCVVARVFSEVSRVLPGWLLRCCGRSAQFGESNSVFFFLIKL